MSQPPAPDDPSRSGSPGQREPTQQFTPSGQQPGPYPGPGQQSGQQSAPGQWAPSGQHPPQGQYPQGQYAPSGQYPQQGQYPPSGSYPQQGQPQGSGYGPPPGPPWAAGPGTGGPGGPPPSKGGNGTVITLVVVGVLVVVGIGIALFLGLRGGSDSSEASPPETVSGDATSEAPAGQDDGIPPPTEEPTGLGDDAAMDELARDCFDGAMQACDDLFLQSPSGSAYEDYGDTCAGRQASGGGFCTMAFPD